jgi:hypothetical protein
VPADSLARFADVDDSSSVGVRLSELLECGIRHERVSST